MQGAIVFFAVASRTIAAFDWPEQGLAVAISWMFKTVVRCVGFAALLGSLLLGGLHADWDFSQISRKSQALYGLWVPGRAVSMRGRT